MSTSEKENFINSINLNSHTDFPYLILNVTNDTAVPRNPGFRVMHWHEDLQFLYVISGTVKVTTLEETVFLSAGEGIFINKNVVHLVEKAGECCYKSFLFPDYFVSFYLGSPAGKLTAGITNNPQLSILPLRQAAWQKNILKQLSKLIELEEIKTEFYPYEVLVTLCSLWLILLKNIEVKTETPKKTTSRRMQSFLLYIEENYRNDITLESLSAAANVSKSECLRCFKETLHTSPFAYLIDYRLSKALPLLTETDLPVSEVAALTGFHGQSYFGKCFKEKTGCSPREYRWRKVKKTKHL